MGKSSTGATDVGQDLPKSAGHPFFDIGFWRNRFDAFVEGLCAVFYVRVCDPGGSVHLEGSSERAIAWLADSRACGLSWIWT